ncbi:MAG: hypothetical protein KAT00_13855, partial [Planctomycetes bacterium]|nr:hypothetical protein [Planctomycetota bacterium]
MCKKQFLLLMLMVSIVAAPGWAAIIETFTIQDAATIDVDEAGETPATMTGGLSGSYPDVHSEYVWGGYSNNGTSNSGTVRLDGRSLIFGSNTVRVNSFAYTIFDGATINLNNVAIRAEISQPDPDDNEESGLYYCGVGLIIQDGNNDWFVTTAAAEQRITGDDMQNYTIDVSGLTWEDWRKVDSVQASALDPVTGGDETKLTLTACTVSDPPDLTAVKGGGLYITTRTQAPEAGNANRQLDIDHIIWKENTDPYNVPPFVHAGTDRQGNLVSGAPGDDLEANGYVGIQGNNLEVSDENETVIPTHEWVVVSSDGGSATFLRYNSPSPPYPNAGQHEFAIDPNAICDALGNYVLALVADDGVNYGIDYMEIDVAENAPPEVGGIGGNDNRTVYVADSCGPARALEMLGPYNVGLQYSGATEPYEEIGNNNGFTANINDDGFPRDGTGAPYKGDLQMNWTVLEQPESSKVTFWVTDGKGGPRVETINYYDGPDGADPNIVFDTIGEYRLQLRAHDGLLSSYPDAEDPNAIADINVIKNQRPTVNAGLDFNVITTRNATATLEGSATDDDFPKCPNELVTLWIIDDAPEGSAAPIFSNINDPGSQVTFGTGDADEGLYTLRLQASDGDPDNGDVNDIVDILVSTRHYVQTTLRAMGDTYTRGGNSNNYGARHQMRIRTRLDSEGEINWASSNNRIGYVQFDLGAIPGNPKHIAAKFNFVPDNNFQYDSESDVENLALAGQSADTIIYAVTNGVSGGWREGDADGSPPTDSTGDAGSDPMLGLTGNNTDVTLTELYRHDYIIGDTTSIANGGTALKNAVRTPDFPVGGMLFQGDDTVAFAIMIDQDLGDRQIFSKEATNGNSDIPATFGYAGPELKIYYDPNQPYSPKPGNEATDIPEVGVQLAWKAQASATFEVYLSSNKTLVENLTGGLIGTAYASTVNPPSPWDPSGDPNVFFDVGAAIGDLNRNTTYYWSVVGEEVASDVWQFNTVEEPILIDPVWDAAGAPAPYEMTPGDQDEEIFSWTGASSSERFDMYLHTDKSLVDALDPSALAAEDITSPFDPNFSIDFPLSNNQAWELSMYWKIVGYPPTGDPLESLTARFTLGNNCKVENFDEIDMSGFIDGLNNYEGRWTASGGGTLTWHHEDFGGGIMGNNNCASLTYNDSSGEIATAKFTFVEPRNWSTAVNHYAFRLLYHGAADNDLAEFNLTITDTEGGTHTETYPTGVAGSFETLINEKTWADWSNEQLPLAPFATAGVDLSSVESYAIGIGDGTGTENGTFYFDAVQIFSHHCRSAEFDYLFAGGDCDVDINEVTALSEIWMSGNVTIDAASTEPSDKILHWKFDSDLTDSSGRSSTGEYDLSGGTNFVTTDTAPIPGNVASFRGTNGTRIQFATKAKTDDGFAPVTSSMTASLWLKGDNISVTAQDNLGDLVRNRLFRVQKGGAGTDYQLEIPNGDGSIRVSIGDADAPVDTDDATYNDNVTWGENDVAISDFE